MRYATADEIGMSKSEKDRLMEPSRKLARFTTTLSQKPGRKPTRKSWPR
ncbi:hypothetical protein MFFC18_03770 [Mariniblastus fucicola]|uniref:Uncharacterized protein n=1 Tax=Mariniblastus fucicola TaxID=980251 RepID=A0A5B9P2G2_9BACT|nr:hypothetical protein MFFC18_03770 [Mariniblastus fucicola]